MASLAKVTTHTHTHTHTDTHVTDGVLTGMLFGEESIDCHSHIRPLRSGGGWE